MAPSIPDRWIPYKALGKVIEGTRIICFKVPLRTNVQRNNKDIKEIWDTKTLLQQIPNLSAVIDLTNTSKYYDPMDLQAAGVLHKKILMPGRIIPPENKVTEFMDAVDEFLGKDGVAVQVKRARLGLPGADSLIGVHCTHGLNRTGYMVCRYMRDRLAVPASEAIKRFEKARGYEIEREIYTADLLKAKPKSPRLSKETTIKSWRSDYNSPLNDSLYETPRSDTRFSKRRYDSRWESRNGQSSASNWRTRSTSIDYSYDY